MQTALCGALDAARRNSVFLIVREMLLPAIVHRVLGPLDRIRNTIGVENHASLLMPRSPSRGLDQRSLAAQESLLVRVEDRHERHLRQIESFPQQIDPD